MKKLANALMGLMLVASVSQPTMALAKANNVTGMCGAECVDISITPAKQCESFRIEHVGSIYLLKAHCASGFRARGLGDPKYDNNETLNFAPAHDISYAVSANAIIVVIGSDKAQKVRPNNLDLVKTDIRNLLNQASASVDSSNRPVVERMKSLKSGIIEALK